MSPAEQKADTIPPPEPLDGVQVNSPIYMLARAGYHGYSDQTHARTFDDRHMPTWDELPMRIQLAWVASTIAVIANFPRALASVRTSTEVA